MSRLLFLIFIFPITAFSQVWLPVENDHPGNTELVVNYERIIVKALNRQSFLYLPQRTDNIKVPMVVFGHGQALDESAYNKTLEHIASKGSAALFVQFDSGFFDQNWTRMASDFNEITSQVLKSYPDQIDSDKIVYSGHSKGGYVALMAAGAPNKIKLSSLVIIAPADYNKDYLQKIDPKTAVTVIIGEGDQVINVSSNKEIYDKLNVNTKQFITVRSYTDYKADHYIPLNKRFIFGGQDGLTPFHHHGVWKWLVAAAWDAEDGNPLTQPYLYGESAGSSGDPKVIHDVVRNFKPRKEYLVKISRQTNAKTLFANFSTSFQDLNHNWFKVLASPDEMARLSTERSVISWGENLKIKALSAPNDLSSRLWHLDHTSPFHINALNAWGDSTGSHDVVVAVIDSGIKINHPDLKDNLWINQAELNGEKGVDDDQNGFVDDVHGYNFATKNPNPDDTRGHGTLVSGLIGAHANNNQGIVGVSWDVSLMALNMFPNLWGDATLASAVSAIDYARENGAHIINASWGSVTENKEIEGSVKILFEAVERAEKDNVLFIAAAGNSAFSNDLKGMVPATLPNSNIVSVGATNKDGKLWAKSNYGEQSVHVLAPGEEVTSIGLSGGTNLNSGTSLSAPIISGIAALMLSLDQSLTPQQIKSILVESCNPKDELKTLSQCGGTIDAKKALTRIKSSIENK